MLAVEVERETAEWSRSTVQHGQTPFVNRLIPPNDIEAADTNGNSTSKTRRRRPGVAGARSGLAGAAPARPVPDMYEGVFDRTGGAAQTIAVSR